MSKHQLTISPDYVQDWTYVEAVREIFQNALDNQTTTPENEMFFNYEDNVLRIGNKTSVLTLDTLLLGSSSKRNDKSTIGRHGEGYKVALMVLLREKKNVTIYNYGAREIWTTRLVKSRTFNGALITEINVQKKAPFTKVPSHNLLFEITGVTEEEFEAIKESNLHLQDKVEKITTKNNKGDILLSDKHKGKIFVNGLFITYNEKFSYGYNMSPAMIDLDRDRKLVDTFNLSWATSSIWKNANEPKLVADLLTAGSIDAKYVKNHYTSSIDDADKDIATHLVQAFREEHGENTIPVSDNRELQRVARQYKGVTPVLVKPEVAEYLREEIKIEPEYEILTPRTRFENWLKVVEHKLSSEELEDFKILLDEFHPSDDIPF